MISRLRSLGLTVACICALGAGCSALPWSQSKTSQKTPVDLSALSSADRTAALRMVPGATVELRERSIRTNGQLLQSEARATALRTVRAEEFENGSFARLSWRMNVPIMEMGNETREARGTVERVDLAHAHQPFLPILWFEGDGTAPGTSGIWLSKDVFEELTRTRASTIYMGILDALAAVDHPSSALKRADTLLHQKAAEASRGIDVDLMKVQGEVSDWPLFVNDASTTVQVIQVHGWYGDLVILNNPDNPLILKFTLQPPLTLDAARTEEFARMKDYVEFEVTRIKLPASS